jgi:hypothetical protein
MQPEVATYLEEVQSRLHLDPRTERRVISELTSHFDEKVIELRGQGVPEEAAARAALDSFGDARLIARLMYESYSRGSWTEALISCQPHLWVAALFATHVWRHPLLLGAAFAAIIVIALLGWRNGTPNWLYSWVGYAMAPLLIASYLCMDPVAQTVSWVLRGAGAPAPMWQLGVYALLYVFTTWLIASTAVTAARRDWILLSLMLLPLPVMGFWLVTVSQSVGVLANALQSLEARFSAWDGAMADFFLVLAVTTALFVRVRRRHVKVLAVVAVGVIASGVAARRLLVTIAPMQFIVVLACLAAFITVPLLIHGLVSPSAPSESRT